MTPENIIRMAREAGFVSAEYWPDDFKGLASCVERFAALVAAPLQERIQDLYKQLNEAERELDSQYKLGTEVEREACAKVCDDWPNGRDDVYSIGVAIRARGQE